jgi:hypothetical protein
VIKYNALTVCLAGRRTPRATAALEIFCSEIRRRSDAGISETNLDDNPDLIVVFENDLELVPSELRRELIQLIPPGSEGYRVATSGSAIAVSGTDERGILYGLGKLLRHLEIRRDLVTLPRPLRISSTPEQSLRGHQLGYRPTTNAYDMWTKDHFRQYIRDLAFFGTNAIELLPPRTDDESSTPEMLYDQLEMMSWLSKEIHSLGLDVWIWYPNMSNNFSLPETIAFESAEREEIFGALPHVDVVMTPGGDPGDQEPSVLFEWGRIQSEILKKHHPDAELWISGQIFDATPAWQGAFFKELGKEPEWLGGLCHGPWVKGNVTEFRASVPSRYPIRRYPDITHSLSCQYPVRDWDPAWASTHGRECYNPRPMDQKIIHNAYKESAIGSLSYSEGINDDVNKFVWSDQDWDSNTPVRETLRDYARLFISPDHVEEISEGLLGFERNWQGPIASNSHIRATFTIWQHLEEALPETARENYRLVLPLVRAYYDEYTRRRYLLEQGLQEQAVSALEDIVVKNCSENISSAQDLIDRSRERTSFSHLKERCIELADRAFDLIRWQTSVTRYKGQAVVRGCFLDAIDFAITDLPFYAQELATVQAIDDPETQCTIVKNALERARPTTTGIFIDMSSVSQIKEIVQPSSWEEDPSGFSMPYIVNMPAPWPSYNNPGEFHAGREREKIIPVIERSYLATFYCQPFSIRLEQLDPRSRYRVKACYMTRRERKGLRLSANGRMMHDFLMPEQEEAIVTTPLPAGCVTDNGALELVWQARPFRVYSEGIAWVIVEIDQ